MKILAADEINQPVGSVRGRSLANVDLVGVLLVAAIGLAVSITLASLLPTATDLVGFFTELGG